MSVDVATPLRARAAHVWTREKDDHYVEPAWVPDLLFAAERFDGKVWDPACGFGTIPDAARRAGLDAVGTDLVNRGPGCSFAIDFMGAPVLAPNIVSNPPFASGVILPFIERALAVATGKVAMLMPTVWANSARTSAWLETTPLRREYRIGPRPSMPPGHVIAAGEKPQGGKVDFSWFVWLRGYGGRPEMRWLRRERVRS